MTDQLDDLVRRLREYHGCPGHCHTCSKQQAEAADAIDSLRNQVRAIEAETVEACAKLCELPKLACCGNFQADGNSLGLMICCNQYEPDDKTAADCAAAIRASIPEQKGEK